MLFRYLPAPALLMLGLLLTQCSTRENPKADADDPFQKTIVPSEYFTINPTQDTLVEGTQGTRLYIPQGAFIDADGQAITEAVEVELAEALRVQDMVLSNLTTTSDGHPLETDGMIYFNARLDGREVRINPNKPVYIEIPTAKRKPGMQVYIGTRDPEGNMNWISPQPVEQFLTPVDIFSLDFIPQAFRATLDSLMPYRHYQTPTEELVDSLYYQLIDYPHKAWRAYLEDSKTDYNEPYFNTSDSTYYWDHVNPDMLESFPCYIDPAIIQALRSAEYQGTFLATREFEARLQVIHKTHAKEILDFYTANLDKNLYEVDSMLASLLRPTVFGKVFQDFYAQRLTRVKGATPRQAYLNRYLKQRVAAIHEALRVQRHKLDEARKQEKAAFEKEAKAYQKLLVKREAYRMEAYGFERTETGWINIDNGTLPKSWQSQSLEVTVANADAFDRVHVYVIYTTMKSLSRLNHDQGNLFYAGNASDHSMLMPKASPAVLVAVGYQGDSPSLAIQLFQTAPDNKLTMTLQPSTAEALTRQLAAYDSLGTENNIREDLTFMATLHQEKQRQQKRQAESAMMERLFNAISGCLHASDIAVDVDHEEQ